MELDGLQSTFMPLPAVTLTFDLLTPKSNQHIYEPKCICDQNWVKSPSLVFEVWCSQRFWDAQTHSDPLTEFLCLCFPTAMEA